MDIRRMLQTVAGFIVFSLVAAGIAMTFTHFTSATPVETTEYQYIAVYTGDSQYSVSYDKCVVQRISENYVEFISFEWGLPGRKIAVCGPAVVVMDGRDKYPEKNEQKKQAAN